MKQRQIERQEQGLAKLVRQAAVSNNRTRLRSATRVYLNSYACRLIAAQEAIKKCKRQSHKTAVQIAQDMNVWQSCLEKAFVSPVARENRDYDFRYILAFGPENQARQILVRNLLMARWNVAPEQVMFDGGRTEAIQRLKENHTSGYRWAMEVDVYHCFRSFDREKIGSVLSLPENVVSHVLSGVSHNIHPSLSWRNEILYSTQFDKDTPMDFFERRFQEDWEQARQGLIEGSKVSPFAAELLLASVCKACSDSGAGQVINYADNFLLMAKTRAELLTLSNVLRESLYAHPAGPLIVNENTPIFGPKQPYDFLGYRITPEAKTLGICWSPKHDIKARKLRRTAYKKINSPNMSVREKRKCLTDVKRAHAALVNSFPEWKGSKQYHIDKMRGLENAFCKNRVRLRRRVMPV